MTPRCFLHIPKCAGSSIVHSVAESFPGTASPKIQEGLYWMADWDPDAIDPRWRAMMVVDEVEVNELAEFDAVLGHFSLPLLRRITPPSSISTVLREPRARLLSHYAYWRLAAGQPEWQGWSFADYAQRSLDDVLESPAVAGEMDNLICRMLVGDDERVPLHAFIADEDIEGVATRAIEALDTLGFVGIVELGEQMWAGMSAFYGVGVAPRTVNTTEEWRATASAPALERIVTRRTPALIQARTAADAIVYRYALRRAEDGDDPDRIADATFLGELPRVGNTLGTSASAHRERTREVGELSRRLEQTEAALQRSDAELARHRVWLESVQGSTSWRLTEPLRTLKQAIDARASR